MTSKGIRRPNSDLSAVGGSVLAKLMRENMELRRKAADVLLETAVLRELVALRNIGITLGSARPSDEK
jgi:hypothetical protein